MSDDKKEQIVKWVGAAMTAFLILTLFSGLALQTAIHPDRFGAAGRMALKTALLPSKVSEAWSEAHGIFSGAEKTRFLSIPRPELNLKDFRPVTEPDGTPISGLLVRGDVAAADHGWRLLGGAMEVGEFTGSVAILLRPDLTVDRVWTLDENDIDVEGKARDSRRILHGLDIAADGSIVFTFDHGSALQRRDKCNRLIWALPGKFHHSVTADTGTSSLWALRDGGFANSSNDPTNPPNTGLVRVNLGTGSIEQEISVAEIMAANPGLGLFELGRKDENAVETNATEVIGRWAIDPVHFNDVEPLPAAISQAFDAFDAGDLLLSARDLNTVMVLAPDTLEVKWHQTGGMLRQHDPDWREDGTISVFDNAMGLGVSRIISITSDTRNISVSFDGSQTDFYSRIRGKHMRTARGDLAIVSPQQGRTLEVGSDGTPILEFINLKPGSSDQNFVLTEYLWLPDTAISMEGKTCQNN